MRIPLSIVLFLLRTFVLGPRPKDFIRWRAGINPETLLSGFGMTGSSLTAFLYLGDLGKLLDTTEWFGGFTGIMKGLIVIYLIIQFIRGLAYLGGTDVIPLYGTSGNIVKFHDGIYRGSQYGPDWKGAFKTSRKSNIEEFTDYIDSRMSMMSNPQREKYFRDFFRREK